MSIGRFSSCLWTAILLATVPAAADQASTTSDLEARIDELGSSDPAVRQEAKRALVGQGADALEALVGELVLHDPQEQEAVAALIASLGSGEFQERQAATQNLLERGSEVLPQLDQALQSPDPEVRWRALGIAEGILRTGGMEAYTSTLRMEGLCEVLGAMGDTLAAPALERALRDPRARVRRAAAHALGRVGVSRSTECLVRRLDDVEASVQIAACRALGRLRDPRAATPLTCVVRDPLRPVEVRRLALTCLWELAPARASAVVACLEEEERSVMVALLDPYFRSYRDSLQVSDTGQETPPAMKLASPKRGGE